MRRTHLDSRHFRITAALALSVAMSTAFTSHAAAAIDTWSGSNSAAWSDPLNWSPQAPQSTDSLVFTGSANTATNNDLPDLFLSSITFDAAASSFSLSGNSFTMTGPVINNSASNQAINLALGGTGGLTFTSAVTNAGTITLTGANTYTGNTTISNNTNVILDGTGTIGSATDTILVGSIDNSSQKNSLTLNGTASITAKDVIVNFINSAVTANGISISTLAVNGTNSINATNITLDSGIHNGSTKGGKAALILGSGATLSLGGTTAGTPLSLLDIANYNYETGGSTGTGISATADFSAGTVNGNITTVNVGTVKAGSGGATSAATANANLIFGNGSLSIDTINVARNSAVSNASQTTNIQAANGNITLVAGSVGTVTAGTASGNGGITFGAFSNPTAAGPQGVANGIINLFGGTLHVRGNITNVNAATAVINLNGGTLDMLNADTAQNGNIGSATKSVTLNLTQGTLRNLGAINGTGGITLADITNPDSSVTHAGIVTLEGANIYTGPTTVTNGHLIVNGSLTSSPITVATGAMVSGNGTLGAPLSVSGTLSPGNGPGILSVGSTIAFADGSALAFDIGTGDAPGVDTDEVLFSSTADNVAGTGSVMLALNGSIDYSKTYTLFQNTTSNSPFTTITGYDSTNFSPVITNTGNALQLSFSAAAVPEPASLALLALGGAALLGRRRK